MAYDPSPMPERFRSPSPTPSDLEEMRSGSLINWKKIFTKERLLRPSYIVGYFILAVITTIVILMTVYHTQIVHWLRPAADWMYQLPAGWTIPIAVLFVISFPPLFGHEIVAVLCGVVWGLWVGFGIVAAGTLLGEIGNFYAFRYCLQSRADKMQKKNLLYACLAKIVREGGFKVALIARFSVIPGHFTTAIFSVTGMNLFVFVAAAVLSMPKQLITVYLGVILEESDPSAAKPEDPKSTIISRVVLGVTILITILAMVWLWWAINRVRPEVVKEMRREKRAKLQEAGFGTGASGSTVQLNSLEGSTLKAPEALSTESLPHWAYQSSQASEYDRYSLYPDYQSDTKSSAPVLPHPVPRAAGEGRHQQESTWGQYAAGWETNDNPALVSRGPGPRDIPDGASYPAAGARDASRSEARYAVPEERAGFRGGPSPFAG